MLMARLHFDSDKKRFKFGMIPLVDTVIRVGLQPKAHSWVRMSSERIKLS